MTLRPLFMEDADKMLSLLTDPMIGKTYMLPDFSDRNEAMPLFERMVVLSADPTRYMRAICVDGMLVGYIHDTEIMDKTIEIGYVITPAHHGKGYMTTALKLAIAELFAQGFTIVTAGAFAENSASIRVMEKSGMHRVDRTDVIEYRGETHQCVYYCIEKQE